MGLSTVKKSMITAVCLALCVVLPQAFHAIPNAGAVYCPIHIPVLLCGLICGWKYGLLCGAAGPVLSFALIAMPSVAHLPQMIVECGAYGAVGGLCMQLVRSGYVYVDVYASLAAAMLAGRVLSGVARALIFSPGAYSVKVWVTGYFITSAPGILIQLILVPAVLMALTHASLIPQRYMED